MKYIRLISRLFIGLIFMFSGFVKAVDPLGSAYKFEDYFTAFGMEWLHLIALPLSFILSAAEFLIGISLFFGIRLKLGSWASTIFMVFFTILTFFLAIYNPVTDCGCFGDALILTNWQTFYKNLIIIIPTLFVFISQKNFPLQLKPVIEWYVFGFFAALIFGISIWGFNHLPLFDFRPYNVGTYIPSKMDLPEGAPEDIYESILIYEKDGIQKEFSDADYPWDDSTWTFVDAEHILIKKGYEPPIHDFSIESTEGDDITDEVIYDESYSFLLIAYDLKKTKSKNIDKINELASFANYNGIRFIGMTSSLQEEIERFSYENNIPFEFYNTDEITLKTIIRSNPGLLLVKEGIILGKWHHNDIPEVSELSDNLLSFSVLTEQSKNSKLILYNLFFISIILIFIYELLRRNLLIRKK